MARSLIFIYMYIGMAIVLIGLSSSAQVASIREKKLPSWMAVPLTIFMVAGSSIWPLIFYFFIKELRSARKA